MTDGILIIKDILFHNGRNAIHKFHSTLLSVCFITNSEQKTCKTEKSMVSLLIVMKIVFYVCTSNPNN